MSERTNFDSTKELLEETLQSVRKGETQLPDFQRGWIWDDDHIRSILASVSLSWPIGAVMMLETGNESVRFRPRLVEGLTWDPQPEPDRLILDGQQRLTSLFRALLHGKVVDTFDYRKNRIKRWYYLDINKALNDGGDREDAIISLAEDRKVKNFRGEVEADYNTTELECAAELFPLNIVYDQSKTMTWQLKYLDATVEYKDVRLEKWGRLLDGVFKNFYQYQIPLILLKKETPKVAVCLVFEKVNTGGVVLTVFELLTATYAADDFLLRPDWDERRKKLTAHAVLANIQSDDFLQAVTLLATRERREDAISNGTAAENAPGISCKRNEVLDLPLVAYKRWADRATEAFEKAARLLYSQRLFTYRDLPYRTQLIPLAAALAVLGDRADNDGVKAKLTRWYWCGVLGELYGSATETRFARDLPEILAWAEGGPEPSTVSEASFIPARLNTMRTRNSAAYKGLHALLIRDGAYDWRTGEGIDAQQYFDERVDIHHIFPRGWCDPQGISPNDYNSIINKTPLSAKTNRIIGGNAPSVYLERLQKAAHIAAARMDGLICSHIVEPEFLRADDFKGFFNARRAALLALIEKAMGKSVAAEAPMEAMDGDAAEVGDETAEETGEETLF